MREKNVFDHFGDFYHAELVENTPPEVMKWYLVEKDWQCISIIVCYSIFVNYLGPSLMRNRKPFDLRWLMVPYNIFLVIANFWIFLEFAKIRLSELEDVSCDSNRPKFELSADPVRYRLVKTVWYFYMTKLIELIDTIIFVLRKKERQLSRLHIIHHTTVPLIVLYMLRSEPREYHSFFPLANSFVHCIMYTYYGIAALGDDVTIHLKFKKYVTITQLIQFILVLYYFISRPFYGCTWNYLVGGGNLVLAGFFFIMFCHFYWHEYVKKQEELNGIRKVKAA